MEEQTLKTVKENTHEKLIEPMPLALFQNRVLEYLLKENSLSV
mgnify:CR=1 FL=1